MRETLAPMSPSQSFAVIAAARLFAFLAIGAPVLWDRQADALLAVGALSLLWIYQGITTTRRDLELTLSPPVEGAAVGIICGMGMAASPAVLAALVVPPLYATAVAGPRTMVRTVAYAVVAVVSIGAMWDDISSYQGVSIFTWTMAGVGLSLIARATFASARSSDGLEPYRDAQQLIRQLIDLSGDLNSGLDPSALGGEMLSSLSDRLPNRGLLAYVRRADNLTPVASTGDLDPDVAASCEQLARGAWASNELVEQGSSFAFPVGDAAIVAGVLSEGVREATVPLDDLRRELAPTAVKLETALLFSQFRDMATADERMRLAREMHDGVAQDIASLGYLVDALAARAADEKQAKQLEVLRERVSKVVAEVRQSVMNLRTSIGEHESLGAAISAVARHLGEASGIPVRVRLDEQPNRLRPDVEAELFRIAQEAMNNAVKHARATVIDVHCQVYPPEARITVSDDGVGLQESRSDSHGLKIMRERAKLIGAQLSVHDNASRGLTVSVVLRAPHGPERYIRVTSKETR